MLRRWRQARDGEGQVALLSGEPGIGKSRLVREVRARLQDEPHLRLLYQCSPHRTTSPLHPVIAQLERAAGFARGDPAATQLEKLAALLARGTDRLDEAVPLVAALLGMPVGERYHLPELTPQRQKQLTLEALVDQLNGLSAAQPVLLAYEDAHWLDPTTQELLGLIIERVQRLPVLLMITFRPEFQPPWCGPHVSALALSRLGRREGAAMVERVVEDKALPAEVAAQIVAKTDGVPLFVEELTKTVLESGLLQDAGDHWELSGPLPPLAIPATLHDSLLARLDRLAPVKEIAQIGAAIGREFSHALLAAVADRPEPDLQAALDQLVSSELVFCRGARPMRPTASSTPWSRTPPTARCSNPAAGTCTPASSMPWRSASRKRPRPSPSCSPITALRPGWSIRLWSIGTMQRSWRSRVPQQQKRLTNFPAAWRSSRACPRAPSATGENSICKSLWGARRSPPRVGGLGRWAAPTLGPMSCAKRSMMCGSVFFHCMGFSFFVRIAPSSTLRWRWQRSCCVSRRRRRMSQSNSLVTGWSETSRFSLQTSTPRSHIYEKRSLTTIH